MESNAFSEVLDPPLSTEEARVLGCLIEKEATTPEAYPLTLNAAVTASNQKTSRHPVMKLDPGKVGQALRKLETRGLVKSEYGARAERYAHRIDAALKLTVPQRALIGLMLLRGPQTLAEFFSRAERMHRFDDLDDVRYQIDRLAAHEPPLAVQLPRGPGQREDRYMHLMAGPVKASDYAVAPGRGDSSAPSDQEAEDLREALDALSARVEALEQRLAKLDGDE